MIVAELDASLRAIVRGRWSMRYLLGEDPALDRPAHVRAGSALARLSSGRLAVVQDDANFVALVDPPDTEGGDVGVEVITLDAGHEGKRQFDDGRGNKKWKLDLEAALAIPSRDGDQLLAFGSGSSAARERILRIRGVDGANPVATLIDASSFYERLRAERRFSGSELNVEGAALVMRVDGAQTVRFFQRGNGAPGEGLVPLDATCDVSLSALVAYLDQKAAPPAIDEVRTFELGEVGGVRLTFTDATAWGDRLFYLAAAEASPDTVRDGPVAGVALGVISPDGTTRYAPILERSGAPFEAKAEGLALDAHDPRRAWMVIDRDEPATPSDLCLLELEGPWLR